MSIDNNSFPFYVKDCAIAAIATGMKAQTLTELRERLTTIPSSAIYYHFWGGRLRTSFEHREYHNDFSSWVHQQLHDNILAERLELLSPRDYNEIEELRDELIELIDRRLEESEFIPWSKTEEQFYFIRSAIIVFNTTHQLNEPRDLLSIIPLLTHSSLFYHFIDAARRTQKRCDDFSLWIENFGSSYSDLVTSIRNIDPYFISLADVQKKLLIIAKRKFPDISTTKKIQ